MRLVKTCVAAWQNAINIISFCDFALIILGLSHPAPTTRHTFYQIYLTPRTSYVYAMRLSGLQKEVLKLYRQCFREARKKPKVDQSFGLYLRCESLLTRLRVLNRTSMMSRGKLNPTRQLDVPDGTDANSGTVRMSTRRTSVLSKRYSEWATESSSSTLRLG